VGVVLRSSVQSMESKLETFGQRDVAATVGARLDDALEAFDASLQTTFGELDGNLTGIGDESPDGDGADGRIRQLHRSLKVFCRDTNGFAHIFNQNMHNLAESIADRARQSNMKEVELQRVGTVFDGLQQAADAISWKIYSDAWTLTTGMFIASSGLLRGHGGAEPQARAGEDVLAAGEAPPSEAVAPLKMSRAQALTKAMAKLEGQVDDLINHTKEEMRRVAEAVNANVSKLDRAAGESLVMRAIDAELLPEWGRVGEQLHSTSVLLTQCLENAGQDELAARLSSLLDSNISIRSGGALVLEPARPGAFDADLDAFVQREDLLAYSFYKAFAEFLNGLRASPGNGRVVDQRTVLLLQNNVEGAAPTKLQVFAQMYGSICAANGPHLAMAQFSSSDADAGLGSEQSDDAALGTAAVQEAASIAWKIHSAAWVLVADAHKATALLS